MHKYSLARRVVTGFVILAVVTGGFYLIVTATLMHVMERQLLSTELSSDLDDVLADLARGYKITLEKNKYFYGDTSSGQAGIPPWLTDLKPGFHEVFDGNHAFYAWSREVYGHRFVLLRDQGKYERHEKKIQAMMLLAFLVSILVAWQLGRRIAYKLIEPVTQLAQQVTQLGAQPTTALAPLYANDEVGLLASAFDSAFGQLQQVLQRERLFTSDVSHELRTPLMVIGSTCELLRTEWRDNPRAMKQLQRITVATNAMQDLVQTFLQMARTGNTKDDAAAHVTLATLMREEQVVWEPLAAAKGLRFVLQTESEDSGLYHRTLLHAVVNNLLRNAVHYTDQGEVRLVLEQGAFRVEDTGVGVPEAQRDLIFKPFIRGTAERGDGIGLGLSLVQRICDYQGWAVSLQPLPAGGCCFRVVLS